MTPEDGDIVGLDELDRAIVGALVRNARVSFADLGRSVRLSANAVAARVRRLERGGVITGYTAVLAGPSRSPSLEALIDVRFAADARGEDVEPSLAAVPGVVEVLDVTGRADYQVRLACPDVAALHAAVQQLRAVPGVVETATRTVLRVVVPRRPAPAP